jgi:hypothetical protein
MKKFLVVVLVLFCVCPAVAQMFPLEAEVSAIYGRSSIALSGDSDLSLQDIGISGQTTLKSVSLTAALSPDVRVRYFGILPHNDSGGGQLLQQVVFNGVTYGPKDTNSKSNRDIFTQCTFYQNRVEVDFGLFHPDPVAQFYVVGSAGFATAKITLKGVPGGQTSGNDPVETSVSASKPIMGVGVGGFRRQNSVLIKGKIIYDFLPQSRGWLADADLRWEINNQGFVGIGYFYEALSTPFAESRLLLGAQGAKFTVGLLF